MKVVFMGTPGFSVPTLEMLINRHYDVVAVVTQPDKPKGRGNKVTASPIKEIAIKHDIEVLQPKKVKDASVVEKLKRINPDLIVVVAFGQILSKDILDIPKYGCINVHASLLPKYRGAAPIHWAIINGEKVTGVTTMYMDVGCDTGDIILADKIPIEDDDTCGTLHDKLAVLGAECMSRTLDMIETDDMPRKKQNDSEATYVSVLNKKNGLIDWNKSAKQICNLVRGLNPWPSAYTYIDGKLLKIWNTYVYQSPVDYEGKVGEIVSIYDNNPIVQTGDGYLLIEELQLQGRKRMKSSEFLKGYKIPEGTLLGVNVLED